MNERLANFPFVSIFLVYAAYLGYQLYDFHYSPEGQVEMHKVKIAATQNEMIGLKKKLVEGNKFVKSLEVKKVNLQSQLQKLAEYQGTLSDALDVPTMIKLLVTEAKKLELKVDKIEPGRRNPKEYYLEQEFKLDLRGNYHQIVLFSQRVSQLQRILRIEAYTLRPTTAATTRAKGMLTAQLSVRAYQYTLSKEDSIKVGGKL